MTERDATDQDREQPEGEQTRPATDRAQEIATRLGGLLGRTAHRARERGEEAMRDARPEAERVARAARTAADAARPRIEQAGRDAVRFVRDHDGEIKRAARIGAEVAAQRAMPVPLRPIVAAIEADRWRRAPLRDERATTPLPDTEPTERADTDSPPR